MLVITQEDVTQLLHERILRALYDLFCLMQAGLQELYYRVSPWVKRQLQRLKSVFGEGRQQDEDGWNAAPQQPETAQQPTVRRRRRRRKRFYFYSPAEGRGKRLIMLGAGVVLLGVLIFSATKLIGYGMDYVRSKQSAEELRRMYHEDNDTASVTAVPAETHRPAEAEQTAEAIAPTAETTDLPADSPLPAATGSPAEQTAAPVTRLGRVAYPDNPYRIISDRFQKIRRQNKDIIGWLTISGLLDEVVVQRNNEYYLDRDYLGYHNVNGAIFLDENCDLSTRPYTLLLYGHNMKTGLMFGSLRNYEKLSFYRQNPFFSFDTMYENGRYVIFSVTTISTVPSDWRYVNLSRLVSSSIPQRQQEIEQLKRLSMYMCSIDVQAEDQILLMITCVDEDTDRRVIAARRLRDGESEDELRKIIRVTQEK